MDGNQFLKLTPEEGRPYAFKSTMGAQHKLEGQSSTLRRIPSFENLKSKANSGATGNKFLKLTPKPPKNIGINDHDKAGNKGSDGEVVYKSG